MEMVDPACFLVGAAMIKARDYSSQFLDTAKW